MLTSKSPDNNGLTREFYHDFWDVLVLDLATFWVESVGSRVLPLSCRWVLLALLSKTRPS